MQNYGSFAMQVCKKKDAVYSLQLGHLEAKHNDSKVKRIKIIKKLMK